MIDKIFVNYPEIFNHFLFPFELSAAVAIALLISFFTSDNYHHDFGCFPDYSGYYIKRGLYKIPGPGSVEAWVKVMQGIALEDALKIYVDAHWMMCVMTVGVFILLRHLATI